MGRPEAAVIGAGPAGLAAAAMLTRRGIDTLVLEEAEGVGASWRTHYDRLHLHTVRWLSGLPGFPIPRAYGKWVARDDVRSYLQAYAEHHRLRVHLNTRVTSLERQETSWLLTTSDKPVSVSWVVIATGYNRVPFLPDWLDRDKFAGELIHSSRYRNPRRFVGRTVLVVGTGNSGAEIAVDLVEGGARSVWLAVRTPPNILRRDLGGVPTQALGVLLRPLPVPVVDRVTAITQRLTVGDLSRYGLARPSRGTYSRLVEDDILPILDVGLIRALKQKQISVVGAVEGFEGADVLLAEGQRLRPDAVIAATGFHRGLEPLVGTLGVLRADGRPAVHGSRTHPNAPGLYFIGYSNPISGNLRELGIDGKRIALDVSRKRDRSGIPVAAS